MFLCWTCCHTLFLVHFSAGTHYSTHILMLTTWKREVEKSWYVISEKNVECTHQCVACFIIKYWVKNNHNYNIKPETWQCINIHNPVHIIHLISNKYVHELLTVKLQNFSWLRYHQNFSTNQKCCFIVSWINVKWLLSTHSLSTSRQG